MTDNLSTRGAANVSFVRSSLQQAEQQLRGRNFAAAATTCRSVLGVDNRNAPALQMLGIALAQSGDRDGAEAAFQRFLQINPRNAAVHTNVGNLRLLRGDLAGAETCYRKAIALMPNYAEAHFNLGLALKASNRLSEAREALEQALRSRPGYVDAQVQLGVVQLSLGDAAQAVASFDKALAAAGQDHFEALYNSGLALVQLGRFEEAKLRLARAAALDANNHKSFLALGQTLHRLQELPLATSALARAATLKPDDAEAHASLAAVFLDDGWTVAALDEIQKALALDQGLVFAHIIHGRVLSELNRLDESLEAHKKAVNLDPRAVEPAAALGVVYLSRGDSEKARETLERAQLENPDDVRIFLALCQNGRFKPNDPRFKGLEKHLANPSATSAQIVELNFMAGRAHDDLGDHDKAFHYYSRANALQAQNGKPILEEDQIALQARIKEIFTPEFIRAREGVGSQSNLPIFVLGMPRSGTTLSEQILSSHPQVRGAGEVLDLEIAIKTIANQLKITTPMPDLVTLLAPENFKQLGDIYAGRLAARAPGGLHVTDKLPGNFNRVGLIHLALPGAKIIHCIRNPVDCCLSIYTNHFAEHLEHANDLYRLGRFYRRYHSLIEYWRQVLPAGTFLDVKYEDTVSDLEAQARRIIDYCGLEWDPRCLDFQNNKRQVTTLSITQVRQPIYKSSVERWRKYEKHLGPLLDGLGDLAPAST